MVFTQEEDDSRSLELTPTAATRFWATKPWAQRELINCMYPALVSGKLCMSGEVETMTDERDCKWQREELYELGTVAQLVPDNRRGADAANSRNRIR